MPEQPSDLLRRAALVLRENAEVATKGPWRPFTGGVENGDHWYVVADGEAIIHIASQDGINEAQRGPDASYVALMDPTVGLALADWLDAESNRVRAGSWSPAQSMTLARAILREMTDA